MASEARFADVRRILEQHGWELLRISSSHHIFGKAGGPHRFSIPVHRGRVAPKYIFKIEKTLGVRIR